MEAAQNRVVSIIYELRKGNQEGEIVEALTIENPLTFLMGRGNLLPKFEEYLFGLKSGDNFRFTLSSDDAYGPVQENAIVDVPISVFSINGKIDTSLLQIGNVIPMMDNEGRRLNGIVKVIGSENVTMDFNHPMAGNSLYFNGTVTSVREAFDEELNHGHIHQSCNCSEGGCNDGSCSDSNDESCGCGEKSHDEQNCGCGSH